MKCFLYIFLLFLSFSASSQKKYFVSYTSEREYVWPFTINHQEKKERYVYFYNLIFNDSISYSFVSKSKNEKWKKYCKANASKVKHHSRFFKRFTNESFDGVAFPDPRNPFFIYDTLSVKPVYIDSTIKKFKEWRCREAYVVLSPGDTLFALLAIDYPYPYGPLNYIHFPYLPLEIYHPKYDIQLLAKKIEEGEYEIFLPSGILVITKKSGN